MINLTPDSFYPGSRAKGRAALERATQMLEEGAHVLDIGAESTRPGATPISAADQLKWLKPFLHDFKSAYGNSAAEKISVDTRDLEVMRQAADEGVGFINDVSGGTALSDALLAETGVGYVLMHTRGTPQTMQKNPEYGDVVAEVEEFLLKRTNELITAGVKPTNIIWDTGIGFGKNVEHNLTLIARHGQFTKHGHRVMAGVSRKSFIGKILGQDDPADRLIGTIAAQLYLTLRAGGPSILRVHDVKEMADALHMIKAIDEHQF